MSILGRFAARAARDLAADSQGSVLLLIAIVLPVLLGFAGLGLDVGLWQLERRIMQSAIDTAVLSAAHSLSAGGSLTDIETAAYSSFNENAFFLEASDVLAVNAPPTEGKYAGDSSVVEIVLSRSADLLFAKIVVDDDLRIRVRAAAGEINVGKHCILALDEEADSAVEFTGTANADINCGVASNSRSDRAIHVGGVATLRADPAQAFGDIFVEGTATLETNHPPQPNSPKVPDPFGPGGRDLQMPVLGTCDPMPVIGSGMTTLDPGHYCGDLLIEHKEVHFNPGVYVIDGGDFRIKAGSVVTGTGVTFILTGADADDVGVLEITSNSDVKLSAPKTGDYAGILFFDDPIAAAFDSHGDPYVHSVLGGADTVLNGALYSPNREIVFTGGASGTGQCLQIVSRKVTVTGNTIIDNDLSVCADYTLDEIQQTRIRMLE